MIKRWYIGLILGFLLGISSVVPASAQEPHSVLVVYDSDNQAQKGDRAIDGCVRLLAAVGLQPEVIRLTDYRKNDLSKRHYTGVVTLINWPQGKLRNKAFEQDRRHFKGAKLHIGPNVQKDEISGERQSLLNQAMSIKSDEQQHRLDEIFPSVVIKNSQAHNFGKLITSVATYPYGVVNGRKGFLPFYSDDRLAVMLSAKLMQTLFNVKRHAVKPILTVTGITPKSDLTMLNRLSSDFKELNQPYLIAMSINSGAYSESFMAALRLAVQRGGRIVLTLSSQRGGHPEQQLKSALAQLTAHYVDPIGIATDDGRMLPEISRYSNQLILLPAISHGAHYFSVAGHAQQNHFWYADALKQTSLNAVGETPKWTVPVAVTIPLPRNFRQQRTLRHQLVQSKGQWLDPASSSYTVWIRLNSHRVWYRNGHFKSEDLQSRRGSHIRSRSGSTTQLNHVMRMGSDALLWVLGSLAAVLVGLLIVGRFVYWQRFRRH